MDLGRAGTARTSPSAPRGPPAVFWFLFSRREKKPARRRNLPRFLERKLGKELAAKLRFASLRLGSESGSVSQHERECPLQKNTAPLRFLVRKQRKTTQKEQSLLRSWQILFSFVLGRGNPTRLQAARAKRSFAQNSFAYFSSKKSKSVVQFAS